MNYQSDPSSKGKVLEKLASEFSRFRDGVGGHYREEHKSMVISAIGMGMSHSRVAAAAGISMGSIRNWLAKRPRARQLNLVAAPATTRETPSATELICIRLASGVEIDFPKSELSFEFLEKLNCIGGSR